MNKEKKDLLFRLTNGHKPGSDLMSRLVLLKSEIINLVVSTVIGNSAVGKYRAVPTDWPNRMKSDVVYEPISCRDRELPPILLEIQHTVDMAFYLRVNEYCLQMIKQKHVPPIVVAIGINNTVSAVLDMAVKGDEKIPFAIALPCPGWARSFSLINAGTINPHLDTQPLAPLVAIAHFFIEQKTSLISMTRRDDPTIQKLFFYAKEIFGTDIQKYENVVETFNQSCTQMKQQLSKAQQTLVEDVMDINQRKRTAQVLDDGLLFINEISKKHRLNTHQTVASSSSSSKSKQAATTNTDVLPVIERKNLNWTFVNSWRSHFGDEMDWQKLYNVGKDIGLFETYSSAKAVKSSYFRAKSQSN
ncbi:hypothetical protein INT45_007703, partial [Circinella minor]